MWIDVCTSKRIRGFDLFRGNVSMWRRLSLLMIFWWTYTRFMKISIAGIGTHNGVYLCNNNGVCCGKVMFLHLSVSHFVHRGRACIPHTPYHACPLPHTPPAMHPPCHAPPAMHDPCHACPLPCMPPPRSPPCYTPPRDTTRCGQWAGGTHPTGMHSCLTHIFH